MGGWLGQRSAADGRKQRLACGGRQEQKKNREEKKKRKGRGRREISERGIRTRAERGRGESREKGEARRRRKERYGYHDPLDSFYVYNLLTIFFFFNSSNRSPDHMF